MRFSNGTRRGPTYIRWASKTAIPTENLTEERKATWVIPQDGLKSAFIDS